MLITSILELEANRNVAVNCNLEQYKLQLSWMLRIAVMPSIHLAKAADFIICKEMMNQKSKFDNVIFVEVSMPLALLQFISNKY